MADQTKAILVVSFGTSHPDTRKKTIDKIEEEIQQAFPDHKVYRAWTSRMIIRKLKNRDGLVIDTVEEAMQRMKADGIQEVIALPTHVINGIENDSMAESVRKHAEGFASVKIGVPLLTTQQDNEELIEVLKEAWKEIPKSEALVFMGHGTPHYANSIYAALDYQFKDCECPNYFMGTVEAYPSIETLIRKVKEFAPERVHLAPFMIVAGDHAKNDMAGEEEDSWANQFKAAGFEVQCHVCGLGEYPGIRKMFIRHVREA